MTVAQEDTLDPVTDRLSIASGADAAALLVAGVLGLVAAALVGGATTLALEAGSAAVAVGAGAALAFAVTTAAVFATGYRLGAGA